jgi:prefoldin subunit 5
MEIHLPDHKFIVEIIGGGVVAVLAFFGKRTLANYDRRLAKAEEHDEKILEALSDITNKITRIETILDERDKRHGRMDEKNGFGLSSCPIERGEARRMGRDD